MEESSEGTGGVEFTVERTDRPAIKKGSKEKESRDSVHLNGTTERITGRRDKCYSQGTLVVRAEQMEIQESRIFPRTLHLLHVYV